MRKRPGGKGPVVWSKNTAIVAPGAAKVGVPRRHIQEHELPEHLKETYVEAMVLGSLWHVAVALEVFDLGPGVKPPPFPPMRQHWGYTPQTCTAPAGSIAMYAGTVRCEEQGKQGLLRVLRHTFIIGTGRYILNDLNWIRPL